MVNPNSNYVIVEPVVDRLIRRQVPTSNITLFRLRHGINPNMFKINNMIQLTLILLKITIKHTY